MAVPFVSSVLTLVRKNLNGFLDYFQGVLMYLR